MLFRVFIICALCCCAKAAPSYSLSAIAKALNIESTIPAQSKPLLQSSRGIINFSPTSSELAQKIAQKTPLVVRILGDSHIAGDFFSHRLRQLLFKDYSLGFVYPLYPAYHQNIALKYESSNFEILNSRTDALDDYPLGGIVARPTELPAHISLTPNIKSDKLLSKIIFKSPNKEGVIIIEDAAQQRFIISAKNPFVWQILTLKLQYPITLRALNEKVLLGGFFIYDEGGNNIVENLGINGARADIWLKWDKRLIQEELGLLPADLFILCYGSNDALYDTFNESVFLKNYSDLIDTIRAANPKAQILLLAPPPVVKKVANATKRRKAVYKLTKNAKAVKSAIHKLAKQKQTLLFDMEDFINESGGKKKWEQANLAKPDVHLLPLGYRLIADKIFYELHKLK